MPLTRPEPGFYFCSIFSAMNPVVPLPSTAVVLAAGLGSRLSADGPKGLLEVGNGPLIGRSLELMTAAGITEVVLVAGWKAEAYRRYLAAHHPAVRIVENPGYATTGSLASLLAGTRATTGDVLIVESDLLYERRALAALQAAASRDTLLASGFTHSSDEVWVHGRDHRLERLTKENWTGAPRLGELVGLTRLSRGALDRLVAVAPTLPPAAHYEDGLNAICGEQPIEVCKIDDLIWCEIDTPAHLQRAREQVWPRVRDSDHTAVRSP